MLPFLFTAFLVLTPDASANDGNPALVTVNCYDLRVVPVDSATPPPGPLLVFQLLSESAHHRNMPNLMKGKILAPEEKTSGWVFGWSVSRNDELKLGWGDGTSAYAVRLTMSGNKWSGTAQYHEDYEPRGPLLPLTVEMNPVSCNLAKN